MPGSEKKGNYGAILLAIGNHIQEKGWRDICILEVDGGMIVQGTGVASTRDGYQYVMETKLISHDELAKMMAK
ncbi:MAG: hypothetical protein KKA73_24635 [Chloroflexi bacterium]|nr:hypothetical protein [Chloroflexota bacterium]MBU1750882.1 hypothetical protein [Chloroflexota bacterium]